MTGPQTLMAFAICLVACSSSSPAGTGASGDAGSGGTSGEADGGAGFGGGAGSSGGSGSGAAGGSPSMGLPAFPGAEGFGTDTPGGRGGAVYVVTTLSWSGTGSFSEALYRTHPRIIVFAVSGVIDVPEDSGDLLEEHSYVTVAGQTSPGGITFRGGGETLKSYRNGFHDAVFRHLRFRSNGGYDNTSLNLVHHVVFDHCDFSGAEDEAFDMTFSRDFTVQWSTITNSGPGGQVYGTLLAYEPTTNISWHHNFSAHHESRCLPHMHWDEGQAPAGGAFVDFRNNVVYDCVAERIVNVRDPPSGSINFNLVGNYAAPGPNTPSTAGFFDFGPAATVYEVDNAYPPRDEIWKSWSAPTRVNAPVATAPVTTHSASDAYQVVLNRAGAWPRDAMNARTVQEMRDGTGVLGKVDDALITSGPLAPADTDLDGMPDGWETQRGLDANDAADAASDRDNDGYTNIEEYINELADQLVP